MFIQNSIFLLRFSCHVYSIKAFLKPLILFLLLLFSDNSEKSEINIGDTYHVIQTLFSPFFPYIKKCYNHSKYEKFVLKWSKNLLQCLVPLLLIICHYHLSEITGICNTFLGHQDFLSKSIHQKNQHFHYL